MTMKTAGLFARGGHENAAGAIAMRLRTVTSLLEAKVVEVASRASSTNACEVPPKFIKNDNLPPYLSAPHLAAQESTSDA